MNTPTISRPCLKCGMEKGHSLSICPTCQLIEAQEEANRLTKESMSASRPSRSYVTVSNTSTDWSYAIGEVLGGIIALVGFCYFVYWLFT